uniref:Uncharacterized protein n=1 Tax=Strongyloides venezuelensis TaxID=75913 RepID=A0A0K0G6A9_STRVS
MLSELERFKAIVNEATKTFTKLVTALEVQMQELVRIQTTARRQNNLTDNFTQNNAELTQNNVMKEYNY